MARRTITSLVVIATFTITAGCSSSSVGDPTSTTSTSLTTTSVQSTTTTTVTPTTEPATEPSITVATTRLFSDTGEVVIEGHIDQPATVSVDGVPAESYTSPDGRTTFQINITLPEGMHDVEVRAETEAGVVDATTVQVVVDPTLEREFSYLVSADAAAGSLVADYAQWFVGDEAEIAAQEDGNANPDGTVDGGFYIRNVNDQLRTLAVADDVVTILQACWVDGPCVTRESVPFAALAAGLDDPTALAATVGWQWYGSGALPFWLLIDEGTIVQIEEQYLP